MRLGSVVKMVSELLAIIDSKKPYDPDVLDRARKMIEHMPERPHLCNGDGGEGERLYGLKAGHVLTEQDAKDIENQGRDYNDEIGQTGDLYMIAREQVLFEIGGAALVEADNEARLAEAEMLTALAMKKVRESRARALEKKAKIDREVQ